MKRKALNMLVNPKERKWLLLYVSFLIVSLTGIFYTIYGEKYIYQDGAWYFFDVLATKNFIVYPVGRSTCHKLQQLPVLVACRYGLSNIKTIGVIFGLSYSIFIYLFWGLTIAVCRKHKRLGLAELISIYMLVTLLFIGFFTIIESTVGAALYCFEMVLFLLHEDKKEATAMLETIFMLGTTALTLHFNEYFVAWSVILAIILLYRVIRRKIHPAWLIVVFAHVYIAIQSKTDMAGRGPEAQPKFLETIRRLFQNHSYFLYMFLIIAIVILSYDFIAFRGQRYIINILEACLFFLLAKQVYKDSATIAVGSYPMRFTTFGWGICLGFFLIITEFFLRGTIKQDLIYLCILLTLIIGFFNRRTAHQLRDFHSWEVGYCYNNPGRGYIPIEETSFQGSQFNADWIGTLGAFDAEMLRGIDCISSVIDITWADVYGRLDPKRGQIFEQYGIYIDYDSFENNPQLPEF